MVYSLQSQDSDAYAKSQGQSTFYHLQCMEIHAQIYSLQIYVHLSIPLFYLFTLERTPNYVSEAKLQ